MSQCRTGSDELLDEGCGRVGEDLLGGGVLLDVAAHCAHNGVVYGSRDSFRIEADLLDEVVAAQGVELRYGDILMVRLLERCEVQINQQKLFRGSLFEEDGALFLTSLESVKNP